MSIDKTWIAKSALKSAQQAVEGEFVSLDQEVYYCIRGYHLMQDFFMTIVSDSDHWMYLSSNGALTAGRKDRDNALFPYYTEDKIHDFHGITGSKTILRVEADDKVQLWEPFAKAMTGFYTIERNIYKSLYGNKVIFEEINQDLGLSFRYGWYNSDRFGFVKRSEITNLTTSPKDISVLDGFANILPSEVHYSFQNEYSNLLDGYKKNELLEPSALALFMLSAIPVDRAEPSECLRATTVWTTGLDNPRILLSNKQLDRFRYGMNVSTEKDTKGLRGGWYQVADLSVNPDQTVDWMAIAEINQSSNDVGNLLAYLDQSDSKQADVLADIKLGTQRLKRLVASSDGIQVSREDLSSGRHFSNTLFNLMRGGVYLDQYWIERRDFVDFVQQTNRMVYDYSKASLDNLPERFERKMLIDFCQQDADPNLNRIALEYLPLTFSRRHGDPSRPWNLFSIVTRDEDGNRISDYQGNWRDIFQNWEALSLSYPDFIDNIIAKFLNASTADGYNPYRIMKSGIDWESPDPDDPWAYIGYWGDHQIIYLQKLLELSEQFQPGRLSSYLHRPLFAYANVPYRIKSYQETVADPQNTIDFDEQLEAEIDQRVSKIGADGKLILAADGGVYLVNMAEKILLTMLVKLSNFIPDAGIWMNTQRPEWNDANNALVGNGVSMVTLCYLRRFVAFWLERFSGMTEEVELSSEVADFLHGVRAVFETHHLALQSAVDSRLRRGVTDALGKAGSDYRQALYQTGFSGDKVGVKASTVAEFLAHVMPALDATIRQNRRADGLYHAYNLIRFSAEEIHIRYLYEMLEGQVAVLSSGLLDAEQSLEVMDSLKASALFREDQYSYLLYPDRELPRFDEKNQIPPEAVQASSLLTELVKDPCNPIIRQDALGNYHFNADFHNDSYLEEVLDKLDSERYGDLVRREKQQLLDVYESMFDHQSFTGRSGTFYAYEGLGSIYWHMVSKLLLAANESYFAAVEAGASEATLGLLKAHYYEIKAGIGLFKSPDLYGAFPTDAYSHTVRDAGVKQPGMTGQVKEDIISRQSELGVLVRNGEIHFNLHLINPNEFLSELRTVEFINLSGKPQQVELFPGQLALSVCQVPVIYKVSDDWQVCLYMNDGEQVTIDEARIPADYSRSLFERRGEISRIEVSVRLGQTND